MPGFRTHKSHNVPPHSGFPGRHRRSFPPPCIRYRFPSSARSQRDPGCHPAPSSCHSNQRRSGRRDAAHSHHPAIAPSFETTGYPQRSLRIWGSRHVPDSRTRWRTMTQSRRTNLPGFQSRTMPNRVRRRYCPAAKGPPLRSPCLLLQGRIGRHSTYRCFFRPPAPQAASAGRR